mmetsp:Transcript_32080/g.70176  ORF Transcript_32080/g.70176 Transcript_32080/m.70176 type:complete len:355 (-) Transcript_32080:129-1193(-)|eukprot:CAMPEP_0170608606 /NCGR_PEP_ID=MMETSP0224-20130122/21676_1 /TAXON_ID=285029 /ORGANISM="Togula jolla, Strain CCCM 725" /LENGTH=354 /DNA_ID=CAMNT_0010933847 /DNA_START=61 /DNA_END=1125 /DNA_ORIENTATION=-
MVSAAVFFLIFSAQTFLSIALEVMQSASRVVHRPLSGAAPTEHFDEGKEDCITVNSGYAVGDLHTYFDWYDKRFNDAGANRCYRLYTPPVSPDPAAAPKALPVIVFFHEMYDRATHACSSESGLDLVAQAEAQGYALLCADANVHWDIPQPVEGKSVCNKAMSSDHQYVRALIKTIQKDPRLDSTQIFFTGHSEGAAFSIWASMCFAKFIRGVAPSGMGIKMHGSAVTEEQCDSNTAPDYNCKVGLDDGVKIPDGFGICETCEYTPIKPFKAPSVTGEDLKICLLSGCQDYFRPTMWQLSAALTANQMPHTMHHFTGQHVVPEGYANLLTSCFGIGKPDSAVLRQQFTETCPEE